MKFSDYKKTISDLDVDTRVLLNYEIHYREIDEATFKAENVTKFGGRDACGNDEWMIDDHQPSSEMVNSEGQDVSSLTVWPEEVTLITDGIKPYSYYAIFASSARAVDIP